MKKPGETAILIIAFTALTALAIYTFKQLSALKNVCFYITGGIINSISPEKIDISLMIGIKNISSFAFTINRIETDVFVNGNYITHISQQVNQVIASQAMTTLSFDVTFSPNNLLKAGSNLLKTLLNSNSDIVISTNGYISVSSGGVSISKYPIQDQVTLQQLTSGNGSGTSC